jgi:hypothetical protein
MLALSIRQAVLAATFRARTWWICYKRLVSTASTCGDGTGGVELVTGDAENGDYSGSVGIATGNAIAGGPGAIDAVFVTHCSSK